MRFAYKLCAHLGKTTIKVENLFSSKFNAQSSWYLLWTMSYEPRTMDLFEGQATKGLCTDDLVR